MSDPSPRLSAWQARLLVFVVALVPRLLHWWEIRANDPFYGLPAVDGRMYHAWAMRLAGGDWLGDEVYFLGPLYPHLMGVLYTVVGPELGVLKVLQALLGALTCVLVWQLAADLFDRRVAWVAGLGAAFYSMLVFYGGTVMIVNLQVPLVLCIALAWLRAQRRPSVARWLAVGLWVGVSALARQTTLLFLPLGCLWLAIGQPGLAPARRAGLAAALLLGGALLVLPATLRNHVVVDDWVLINSMGGASLYMGNNARADGSWRRPDIAGYRVDSPERMKAAFRARAEEELGRELRPTEVSNYWTGRTLAWVASEPLAWARLEMRKLFRFVNAAEIWNNRSIEISREFSWVLRLPLLGLGVVMPLGLLGMGLAADRLRERAALYAVVAVYLGAALLFFVVSRYRMPAVPVLLIFAAHAGVWLFDALRAGDLRGAAVPLLTLVPLVFVTRLDFARNDLYMGYFNLGNKYRDLERWPEAIDAYQKSIELMPASLTTHAALAGAFEKAGRGEEAIERWRFLLQAGQRLQAPAQVERARERLEALGVDVEAPAAP